MWSALASHTLAASSARPTAWRASARGSSVARPFPRRLERRRRPPAPAREAEPPSRRRPRPAPPGPPADRQPRGGTAARYRAAWARASSTTACASSHVPSAAMSSAQASKSRSRFCGPRTGSSMGQTAASVVERTSPPSVITIHSRAPDTPAWPEAVDELIDALDEAIGLARARRPPRAGRPPCRTAGTRGTEAVGRDRPAASAMRERLPERGPLVRAGTGTEPRKALGAGMLTCRSRPRPPTERRPRSAAVRNCADVRAAPGAASSRCP